MNETLLLVAAAATALVLLAPPAAAWPPCTCDPNPVTDLVRCWKADQYCEDYPEVLLLKRTLHDLDPRNWPCTCDPPQEPLSPGPLLA